MKIQIIHNPSEDEPFVILNKPRGLATAPLKDGEDCALTQAVELFPQIKNVCGKKKIEYGLVHRIDTETGGLVLIAVTQEFYDYIQKEQAEGRFLKEYTAAVEKKECSSLEGFPVFDQKLNHVTSSFRPFGPKGREVRPVTSLSGRAAEKKGGDKLYTTNITVTEGKAVCSIANGYRHQVRCHLAWAGYPVKGDRIYNPLSRNSESEMEFFATAISFSDMKTGKKLKFVLNP